MRGLGWHFVLTITIFIGIAISIPLVRAIRVRVVRPWQRELAVAALRGLLYAPSSTVDWNNGTYLPTIACIPFWLAAGLEHVQFWHLTPFAIVVSASLLKCAIAPKAEAPAAPRLVVMLGVWLPLGALAVAVVWFAVAHELIERPGGDSNVNFTLFIMGLTLMIAAAAVAIVVLASSLLAMGFLTVGFLKNRSIPRFELVSAVVGLLVSVWVLKWAAL